MSKTTVIGLNPGLNYTAVVFAYNQYFESGSNPVTFTTQTSGELDHVNYTLLMLALQYHINCDHINIIIYQLWSHQYHNVSLRSHQYHISLRSHQYHIYQLWSHQYHIYHWDHINIIIAYTLDS